MVQNSVKFTFITRAMHKYVNQMRQQTIKEEAKIVCVEMRETYQQYRQGTKCDAKLVPCNCQCHKQKTPSNWCAKCRSVHDLKVRFLTSCNFSSIPELFLVVRQPRFYICIKIIVEKIRLPTGASQSQGAGESHQRVHK